MALSEPELQRVEATFGIALPRPYRQLVLRADAWPAGVEWIDTADALVAINTALLEDPDWDAAFFAIASTGAGDFYCVELDGPDVVLYSHEDRQFVELGRFSEWIRSPGAAEHGLSTTARVLGCLLLLLLVGLVFAAPIWVALRVSR